MIIGIKVSKGVTSFRARVESMGDMTLRTSDLDLDVRDFNRIQLPTILGIILCSCEYNRGMTGELPEDSGFPSYHDFHQYVGF